MTNQVQQSTKRLSPSRYLLFLPYPVLFIFGLFIDYLRLHTIPVSEWVIQVDTWLPFAGFLLGILCVGAGKRFLSREERIIFFIFTLLFVFSSHLFQSPRPQPKYRRLEFNALSLTLVAREYAHTHNGEFPPHWAALLLSSGTNPYALVDSTLSPPNIPYPRPPESEWPTFATEVDAHSIFTYTAADLHDPALIRDAYTPSLDPAIILAYSRPSPDTPNHCILLFASDHPKLIPESDFDKYYGASNAARASLGLPPHIIPH